MGNQKNSYRSFQSHLTDSGYSSPVTPGTSSPSLRESGKADRFGHVSASFEAERKKKLKEQEFVEDCAVVCDLYDSLIEKMCDDMRVTLEALEVVGEKSKHYDHLVINIQAHQGELKKNDANHVANCKKFVAIASALAIATPLGVLLAKII